MMNRHIMHKLALQQVFKDLLGQYWTEIVMYKGCWLVGCAICPNLCAV
jgi:hypothetical protein